MGQWLAKYVGKVLAGSHVSNTGLTRADESKPSVMKRRRSVKQPIELLKS